jgi:flagellar biogenesis protein FliO
MGRNEIKLREKRITSDTLKQYRNYSTLLKKIEREKRYKQVLRIFIGSLIVTAVVLLLVVLAYVVVKWEKQREHKKAKTPSVVVLENKSYV